MRALPDPGCWAIVVAGGSGHRFGGSKQFQDLAGRPVIDYAVDACRTVAGGGIVVVLPADSDWAAPPEVLTTVGGDTRSDSVRAGLDRVPDEADVIVVHDAARPAARAELFAAVVFEVHDGVDAAVPGVPVTDSLRTRAGSAVDRDHLVAVQTPQAFAASALRRAHTLGVIATDDATVVELAGGSVHWVEGDPENIKLTHPHDRAALEVILGAR